MLHVNQPQSRRNTRRNLLTLLALTATIASAPALAAQQATDAAGDFLATYTGPKNGDLDVLSSQVFFDGAKFVFTATMNGPVGSTPGAFYVWGVNRGAGVASFGGSLGLTNVLFDATVIMRPGIGVTASGQAVSDFFYFSGNTITGAVPLSFLPANGFTAENYTWNLWPRATGPAGVAAISDFAPDNVNNRMTVGVIPAAVFVTPEPASFVLVGAGLLGMLITARRRKA